MSEESAPDAATVLAELPGLFESDDAALKAGILRLDAAIRATVKKDAAPLVIQQLALIAEAHPRMSNIFIRMMQLHEAPSETILRALIAREGSKVLLTDTVAWCLQRSSAESADGLTLTPPMQKALRSSLANEYAEFGAAVWRQAGEWRNQPLWCQVWAGFSRTLLQGACDLPAAARRSVAKAYAACIAEAPPDAARKLTPLLAYLVEETGAFSDQAASVLSIAPVGSILRSQAAALLGLVPPAPPGQELEGLPPTLTASVLGLIAELQQNYKRRDPASDSLKLKSERDTLAARIDSLEESLSEAYAARDRAREAASTLQRERDSERTELASAVKVNADLQQELDVYRGQRVEFERRIAQLQESYERLRSRSEKDRDNLEQHLLDGIFEKIGENWHLISNIIAMVSSGERDISQLISAWNAFDSLLAGRLQRSGHPVKSGK